ncbi:MAG: TetR/AcrR family transcriptional regulator, partial [Acidimicrobiales bacterium]|nr:TetR/AcrR family transcriptional regulator [Acidimicrobiales bacterium]
MTTLTLREQKRAERQARVIETALRLAADGGYEAVQMRDVAARSEVALGTIYRYFSSKDAILIAGLAEWMEVVRDRIDRRVVGLADPAERLDAYLREAGAQSVASPTLMKALITALASTDADVSAHKEAVNLQLGRMIESALAGAPDIDAAGVQRVIRHVWFSAIVGWVSGMRDA